MSKFIPFCTDWKFSTSVSYLFSMVNTVKGNKTEQNLQSLKQGFLICHWGLWILPRMPKPEGLDSDGKAALDDRVATRPGLPLLGVVADMVQWTNRDQTQETFQVLSAASDRESLHQRKPEHFRCVHSSQQEVHHKLVWDWCWELPVSSETQDFSSLFVHCKDVMPYPGGPGWYTLNSNHLLLK